MKNLYLFIALIFFIGGCSSIESSKDELPPEFVDLNVSLNSDVGKIALASIKFWSDSCVNDKSPLRFVPLSDEQIKELGGTFVHKWVPGARARWGKEMRIVDRFTKEEGIAVGIYAPKIIDDEVMVRIDSLSQGVHVMSGYRLIRTNGSWQVLGHTNFITIDVVRTTHRH